MLAVGGAEILRRFFKRKLQLVICIFSLFLILPYWNLVFHVVTTFPIVIDETWIDATRKDPAGGWSMTWLRLKARPDQPIVTTGFNLLYYTSDLNVASAVDDVEIDNILMKTKDITEFSSDSDSARVVYYWM